jgi:cell division septum initiation protein DivIVA
MNQLLPAVVIVLTICLLGAAVSLVRLYRQIHNLERSFAKLAFVTRQDLQQYFEEAASKVLETQSASTEANRKSIEEAIQSVVDRSSQVVQQRLAQAESEAAAIVLRAHQERQQILDDARKESRQYLMRLTDYSAEAIEWGLEQLVKEKIDISGHEELVKSLVSVYLDEHKRI